jgi:hypothetical protein
VQGITVPDDWYQIDGAWEALELKSDLIDAPTADLPGLTALARRYLADARGDAENLPLGARYALWFIRDPGPAGRAAMMAELSVAGSPVTRVRFGSGQWQTVSAP